MLSLKKRSEAQPVAAPRWHINFRNFERLPDTKVVRTTFFVNTAAIALAIGMALLLGYREYTNRSIREQIGLAQSQVDNRKKENAEAIRLSQSFAEEQRKLQELSGFVAVPITMAEFMDVIASTLPNEVIIDYMDARWGVPKNSIFQIRGRVAGTPDQASGLASNYVETLRANPRLKAVFDPITLNRIDRNPDGTFLLFDISLTLKAAK